MDRVEVTAKAGCIYDGIPRPEGTSFDCAKSDARILKLIGKVDLAEGQPADSLDEPAPEPVKKKRTYKRKDMVAEG